MDTFDLKSNLNWKVGTSRLYAAPQPASEDADGDGDGEYWKHVLSNQGLRSRFIRDLEVQSIVARDPEDLSKRYHEEEIFPRRASAPNQNSRSNRT